MNHINKGKAKYIFSWLLSLSFVVMLFCFEAFSSNRFFYEINNINDTVPKLLIPQKKDTTKDTLELSIQNNGNLKDTIKTDSLQFNISKDTLSGSVSYMADDSLIVNIPEKLILLYGKKSKINYLNNELAAPFIQFDQNNSLVAAFLQKDSLGKVIAYPTYSQNDFKSISDSVQFNMKNGKGITKGTYTQQDELFIYGEKLKKIDSSVFYALKGRFTTCNLDTPHFAFVSNKVKLINKKMAFTGPVHPEFEGVPIPLILPFGIFPIQPGFHSGLIAPNFTANDQLGLALEGLGYYKIFSPYWDAVFRGTLYSYGSWTLNISPRYYKRYRYQGSFGIDIQHFKNGFEEDPNYSVSNTYNFRWSHSADTKARPGVTFSANVNAGSTSFNSYVPNNPTRNFQNQMSSSITYSKVWKDRPFNLSVSANHNQNNTQKQINIFFPDLSFNVNTIYPFRREEPIGAYKWYENIGIALNTSARSTSSFYDTLGNIGSQMSENLKWGASHNIPISLSLPSLGPIQIAPSVTYQEKWYQEKFERVWNGSEKKLDTVITRGLYTARDMSFGISASTRIFGMFGFRKNSSIQAIRHEIRPSISINYKPNFNAASYYETQIDSSGNTSKYSYYERSVYGAFSDVRFAGLNFGLDNILQMKIKNSKDTSNGASKKVSLLDGFSINGSYNFLVDSFNLSNLTMSARTNLLDKINITANAQFDPYIYNESGRRTKNLIWTKEIATLGKLMSAGISLQSRFSGGDKKNSTSTSQPSKNNIQNNNSLQDYQREATYINNNPNEFVDFNSPWDLDFAYSLRYTNYPSYANPGSFDSRIGQDINFNGNFNLTSKWKFGMSGSYNITTKELGMVSINISRDLHCWQMNLTMSPVGRYKFFTINISPKSALLRDIKVNRTRYFYEL